MGVCWGFIDISNLNAQLVSYVETMYFMCKMWAVFKHLLVSCYMKLFIYCINRLYYNKQIIYTNYMNTYLVQIVGIKYHIDAAQGCVEDFKSETSDNGEK